MAHNLNLKNKGMVVYILIKNKKIYLLTIITVCLAIFVSQSASAAKLAASTQLKKLLNSYGSYEASFKQITVSRKGRVVARNNGRVALQHPRKFRWHTQTPTEQILIANGKTLWVYDVDLQQATKRKFTTENSKIADLLSGGGSKIIASYNISVDYPNKKLKVFSLLPRKKALGNSLFRSVKMKFKNAQLYELEIDNNLDEITRINFYNIKINRRLPGYYFNFKPPRGVDVLKDS